jgi:hypothetical protein
MFPVGYKLNLYILLRRNLVFKGLIVKKQKLIDNNNYYFDITAIIICIRTLFHITLNATKGGTFEINNSYF